jgi:HlyD family secretion protein
MTFSPSLKKKLLVVAAAAVVVALAWWGWTKFADSGPGEGFVSGNGRIEATEIDIATKLPGRIEDILVREGDFVSAGQPLARMQLETLEAQRDEAFAMREQAEHSVTAAQARVALREADVVAAQALVGQRESELDAAQRRLKRSQTLSQEGAASIQELDDDRARVRGAQATLAASKAQVAAARAAVEAAKAQLVGAQVQRVTPPRPVSTASKPTSATANCARRVTDGCRCAWRNPARCLGRADVS